MANFQLSSKRKRGPQVTKLSVRLFLLDPDKNVRKVTKETCSKEQIKELMQNGYGPPQPEHCTGEEKVEFQFNLTNEQFKKKLVEIYPKLENCCFVFMKGDKNNQLVELNPGKCCFRCYTPENVHLSERGQGRLYIQIIPENKISPCIHDVQPSKRLCVTPTLLPKPNPIFVLVPHIGQVPGASGIQSRPVLMASCTIPQTNLLQTGSLLPVNSAVRMVGQGQLSSVVVSQNTSNIPVEISAQTQTSASSITSATDVTQPVHSLVNVVPQSQVETSSAVAQQITSHRPVQCSLTVEPQSQSRDNLTTPDFSLHYTTNQQIPESPETEEETESTPSTITSVAGSTQPQYGLINRVPHSQMQTSSAAAEQTTSYPPSQIDSNQQFYSSVSPAIVSQTASNQSVHNSIVNAAPPNQLQMSSTVISQSSFTPLLHNLSNIPAQNRLPATSVISSYTPFTQNSQQIRFPSQNVSPESNQPYSHSVNRIPSSQFSPHRASFPRVGLSSFGSVSPQTNMASPNLMPSSVERNVPTSLADSSVNMATRNQVNMRMQNYLPVSLPGLASENVQASSFQGYHSISTQSQVYTSTTLSAPMINGGQFPGSNQILPRNFGRPMFPAPSQNASLGLSPVTPFESELMRSLGLAPALSLGTDSQNLNINMLPTSVAETRMTNNESSLHGVTSEPNAIVSSLPYGSGFPSSGIRNLDTLASAAVHSVQRGQSTTTNANNTNLQEKQNLAVLDKFVENVKSTGKIEISLDLLGNDVLLKKLDSPSFNICTVEIQPTCKLQDVLSKFSLPSELKVLRIHDNNLDNEDIFALIRFRKNLICLDELDTSRTKWEGSPSVFLRLLDSGSDLQKLVLTDNSLTKKEFECLFPVIKWMKNLKNLTLSKNNIDETQANYMLQNLGNSIVSLDLSRNAIQGNEITVGLCKPHSVEELNLSHNRIRFDPLPDLEEGQGRLPPSTKYISLSYNYMIDEDISRFCSLVASKLLKLNLDFNHVGPSVWSLCSLRCTNLKALSLANADICGATVVRGLASLLAQVKELEELDLSSNNLIKEDFEKLKLPLSNLTKLKMLNLSNNPDGILLVIHEILPSLKYLEELRLSNIHLNGEDCFQLCKPLALLKGLKHLDLSDNAVGAVGVNEVAGILKDFLLLERLDMSKCCVTEDQISVLCQSLVSLSNLKYLNLSGNRIDIGVLDEALFLPSTLEELILSDIVHGEKLFERITLLKHLRKLHLSEMKLSDRDSHALATMLRHLSLLEELVLTDIAEEYEEIFSAIKSLKSLKKIDLSRVHLPDGKGLSEMLSSLSSLQELILSGINIEDRNYDVIFKSTKLLKSLKKLDLSDCTDIFCTVPCDMLSPLLSLEEIVFSSGFQLKDISALQSLKYLKKFFISLKYNYVQDVAAVLPSLQLLEILALNNMWPDDDDDDDVVVALFTALKSLKYLKELELEVTMFFKSAIVISRALAEVLPSLQFLEKLTLIGWVNDDCKQLSASLKSWKYLKELHLEDIKIDDEDLAEVLPSLQLLEKLTLIHCVYDDCKQLSASLKSLKYLKELHLEEIDIDGEALAEVLPSLQLLEKLTLIRVDDDCKHLFASLKSLKYLKELHLEEIDIDGEALAEVLPSLRLLEKLVLDFNYLNDEDEIKVFPALKSLKYLKILSLSLHHKEVDLHTLAKVLPYLQFLHKLTLKELKFTNANDQTLFTALRSLRYLKELDLHGTTITQAGAETLKKVLPSLNNLTCFWLPSKILNDENRASYRSLLGAARSIPGLKEVTG